MKELGAAYGVSEESIKQIVENSGDNGDIYEGTAAELLNLEERLLNVPSGFKIPEPRPTAEEMAAKAAKAAELAEEEVEATEE